MSHFRQRDRILTDYKDTTISKQSQIANRAYILYLTTIFVTYVGDYLLMIVMKFGGSSVKSADDLHRIVHIIEQHLEQEPVIVVSAFSQVTNRLENTATLASKSRSREAHGCAEEVIEEYRQYAEEFLSPAKKNVFYRNVDTYRDQITQLIDGVSLVGELTPRTVDQFSSYGERMASLLLTLILQETDVSAELIGVENYLFTTPEYSRAIPLFEDSERAAKRLFFTSVQKGNVPITPGFIGVTKGGIWTTMGRESSDYTATLLGSFLSAHEVQLWKEVEGIRTTDPAVMKYTRVVEQLSYDEALELANLGAKVLHPRTILPVIKWGIPIRVLSSKPKSDDQTMITRDSVSTGVKTITYVEGVDLIRVSSAYQVNGELSTPNIHQHLKRLTQNIYLTLQVGPETIVVVNSHSVNDELLTALQRYGQIEHTTDTAFVGIVGENIGLSPKFGAQLAMTLKDIQHGILISGASSRSLCAVVPNAHGRVVVEKLHAAYFSEPTWIQA